MGPFSDRRISVRKRLAKILAGACCVVGLVGFAVTQQSGSGSHVHQAKSSHASTQLPRSAPSSIPDSTKSKGGGRQQELQRIEHSGGNKATPAHRTATRSPKLLDNSNSKNSRISFAYTGPKPGPAGHRNTAKGSH
jgi:hypothetical protein